MPSPRRPFTHLSSSCSLLQEAGYEAALACNGEQCDGQTLKVMKCRPSAKDRQQMQQQREQQPAQQQQAQQVQQQQQQYAPPQRYDGGEQQQQERPAWRQPQQQDQQQQQQAFGGGDAPRKHAGPAPKTPGYHVAYVGKCPPLCYILLLPPSSAYYH